MKNKKIIVPVDFTVVAFNALKYAYDCFPDCEITVLNVVPSSVNSTEYEYSLLDRYTVANDKIEKQLQDMIIHELKLKELPSNIKVKIVKGEVIAELKNHMLECSYDAIVMGTRDKYDLFDKVVGTVSLAIVKSMECPVYLIPRYASYNKFNKVMVAVDSHIIDHRIGARIKEWNKNHNAFIKFLHVINDRENDEFVGAEDRLIAEIFEGDQPSFGFEVMSVNRSDVGKTLLGSAYSFGADLLISMPDKQNFISALLFKSVTKELIQKSSIPLLFIHPLESVI